MKDIPVQEQEFEKNLTNGGYIAILGGIGSLIIGFYRHPSKG
jgi:hypothetical protein